RSAASPKPSTPSRWPAKPDTTPSFRTAPAKRKTRSSPTWPLPPVPARSRPAPHPAPTVSPSTTNFSASRKNSAPPHASPANRSFRKEAQTFRLAKDSDAEALTNLINAAFEIERPLIGRDRIDRAGTLQYLDSGQFLLLEEGDALIGCVYLEKRADRMYLGLLIVDPTHHGDL